MQMAMTTKMIQKKLFLVVRKQQVKNASHFVWKKKQLQFNLVKLFYLQKFHC